MLVYVLQPFQSLCNSLCCALCYLPVTTWVNGTWSMESSWSGAEKWLVVAVLGLEMVMGVLGNGLVLLVKIKVQ